MLTEQEISVPAVKEHTVKKTICHCDFCGKEVQSWQTCVSCGKQVCRGLVESCRMFDPNEYGDYPDPYCPICYEIKFERFEKDYQRVEIERDAKIEFLNQQVKSISLEEYAKKFPTKQTP